jgi:hypothetical protein
LQSPHRYVLACSLLAILSCQEPPPLYPASAPPEIVEACAVANRKCTACHDRDRIVYARHNQAEWRTTVERMRRFPGSAISPDEIEIILRCLNYSAESAFVAPPSLDLRAEAGHGDRGATCSLFQLPR